MAVKTIEYPSQPSTQRDRIHSRTIWADCPWDQIKAGEKDGVAFHDDFEALPLAPTLTTQIAFGQYKAISSTGQSGVTLKSVATVNSVLLGGGILQAASNASTYGSAIAEAYAPFMFTGSVTNSAKLWFEARVARSSVAAAHLRFFVGFAETDAGSFTLADALPFINATTGVTNTGSFLGFESIAAQTAAGQINTVYNDRAATLTTLGSGEAVQATAYAFTKLGMIYDPRNSTKAVRFFQDGVELSTGLTPAQLTATTNLKANALGLLFAMVAGASVSSDAAYMDWWRVAQLYS